MADFQGIIVIHKEKGFTSHDVVAKLRGILHMKKIGHTGTLDPDATGVLPVALGKGTKLVDLLTDKEKTFIDEYIATGQIQFIEDKIVSLPKWVWLLIMPEYIPIEELKFIFNKYQISSRNKLIDYFQSDAAANRYGEDYANLYCYFVKNQDVKNFPLQYRSIPSKQTQLIELFCNEIILGNFHNHTT